MSQFYDLDRVDRAIRHSVENMPQGISEFCDKNYSEPKVPTLFENQTPLDADTEG